MQKNKEFRPGSALPHRAKPTDLQVAKGILFMALRDHYCRAMS